MRISWGENVSWKLFVIPTFRLLLVNNRVLVCQYENDILLQRFLYLCSDLRFFKLAEGSVNYFLRCQSISMKISSKHRRLKFVEQKYYVCQLPNENRESNSFCRLIPTKIRQTNRSIAFFFFLCLFFLIMANNRVDSIFSFLRICRRVFSGELNGDSENNVAEPIFARRRARDRHPKHAG